MPPSTTAVGLAFERHALRFLNGDLRMALTHVGGRGDGGVDLRGYWHLPSGRRIEAFRILGQCKAEKTKLGPRAVRELEGVLAHHSGNAAMPTVGALLSQSGFTKASMEHAQRSLAPMLLVHLDGGRVEDSAAIDARDKELVDLSDVRAGPPKIDVAGAWWNARLGKLLGEAGVELKRELVPSGQSRVGVWYDGRRLPRCGPPIPST